MSQLASAGVACCRSLAAKTEFRRERPWLPLQAVERPELVVLILKS